jgi:YgiT-type zinc finger domain-containing protein
MICDLCNSQKAKIRYISRSYGDNEELFIIQDIPLIMCPECGESYFTSQTLHQIETIKQQKKSLAINRLIPVASFAN